MSQINQAERARLAWQILVELAAIGGVITYGALGARIGVHHRAVRFVLGLIQDYCLESRIPPLTILVVNGSGRPGTGFIAHDHNDLEGGLEEVWAYMWSQIGNPFDFAAAGFSYGEMLASLVQDPDTAEYVYGRVKHRGMQQVLFRNAVRVAYAQRCAFLGLKFPEALDACHIIPWSHATPQQRLDVRNGILLNPLHHRLFDNAYLTITDDYRIAFWDPKATQREYSAHETTLAVHLHNQRMNIPRLISHRPLPEYIKRHNDLIGWGSVG